MSYNTSASTISHNGQALSQETVNNTTSPVPPQRLPPPPPPKLPPEPNGGNPEHWPTSNLYTPKDPHLQQPYTSDVLDEGQRQYERFQASQKDSVTYSIPSSIWRQEPPTAVTHSPTARHEHQLPLEENALEPTGHRKQASQFSQAPNGEPEWETAPTHKITRTYPSNQQSHGKDENVGFEDWESEQQRSDSFYWQSPHSSIHSTKDDRADRSETAPPGESPISVQGRLLQDPGIARHEQNDTAFPTLLSHSTLGSYGASALGFGGPSDWEHFGDYEAEDIDDTELYIRPKSPVKPSSPPDTAELPAESTQIKNANRTDVQRVTEHPTIAENPPPPDTSTTQTKSEGNDNEGPSQSLRLQDAQQSPGLYEGSDREAFHADGTTESPEALANDTEIMITMSDQPNNDMLATNLNETIEAWSRASSTENLVDDKSIERMSAEHDRTPSDSITEPAARVYVQPEPLQRPLVTSPLTEAVTTQQLPSEQSTSGNQHRKPLNEADNGHTADSGEKEVPSASSIYDQYESGDTTRELAVNAGAVQGPNSSEALGHQPTLAPIQGPASKTQETDDPYAGLDAWGKSSLNRYIAMLREESQAGTDKEKLNIFTVFTTRETRLRAVLYDADKEEPNVTNTPAPASSIVSPIKRASTTSYKRASKALPALPEGAIDVDPVEIKGHTRKPSKKLSAAGIIGNPKPNLKAIETSDASPVDEAYVMADSPNSAQYSPGGRPVVPGAPKGNRLSQKPDELRSQTNPNNNPSSANDSSGFAIPSSPIHKADENGAAYVPFKYNGGRSEAQNYTANRLSKRQSVLRPYSKMMGSDETREYPIIDPAEIESVPKIPLDIDTREPSGSVEGEVELDLRRFVRADFDPLLTVLPEAGDIRSESLEVSDLRHAMDSVPDDFTFIHQSVVAWDTKARRQREFNERERHARQIESEQRIDALFDDNEIGYGDISELESGFKRSEAARKADEDRAEYQTFVSEVFDIVWTRLHYEIDQLTPPYQKYIDVLNSTTAGKDMFDPASDRFALAPTMDSLLTLHQKLEIRHQKAFEAVLERDRRLKKVELSPWYSLGNVAKVKQLERQFDVAEKKAILDYCRQRDIRANSLMDNLDQNTLRGVGANQDYMEMVMKAVRRIASGRAFASQPGSSEPGVGLEEVTKAKSVTKALATSSEQIVQTFHVADMLLNAADYELSVAKARLEGADMATFQNLKEERAKEDQKLMRDLEHRLALIREDSRRTHDEIVKLLLFLGVQSGHAEASASTPKPIDRGHEERIQKALEEAKKRNAALGSTAAPLI